MKKRDVIKAAHVRNERFIDAFKSIIELMPLLCFTQATRIELMTDGHIEDAERLNAIFRMEIALAKVMMHRLEALFDTWPNAVWLFFPETGATGWIRLCNEFHIKIFPFFFPEVPHPQLWGTKRVHGHRWCGVAPRIRKESVRTFRIWDQFKAGGRPMDIVRREFPLRSTERGRRSKKELMAVHRSLERASQLIYGQSLPNNQKVRRLQGFDQGDHMATCIQCQSATKVEQFCPAARDFSNQDQRSFLHNWTSI